MRSIRFSIFLSTVPRRASSCYTHLKKGKIVILGASDKDARRISTSNSSLNFNPEEIY